LHSFHSSGFTFTKLSFRHGLVGQLPSLRLSLTAHAPLDILSSDVMNGNLAFNSKDHAHQVVDRKPPAAEGNGRKQNRERLNGKI
jgi:hypothetical protein